jgi:Skp family chaperone for outer membrane proteins
MKRMLLVCALVGTILVPAALAADPVPADYKNAAKYCQALRTAKGVETFRTQWGTAAHPNKMNAFGKCVSATNKAKAKAAKEDDEKAEDADGAKATVACKKQQSENATKFAQDYKNFGQCVKTEKAAS